MKISNTKFVTLLLIVAAGAYFFGRSSASDLPMGEHSGHANGGGMTEAGPEIWTCSMHPQIRLPDPGKCPICSMDLVLADSSGTDDDLGPRVLKMSANAVALAEITTAPVERRSVAHEVNLVGKIAFDETRLAYITSWVSGRLDRLFVDYTGVRVRANDHLVEIYSPTLISAQQELLQAIGTQLKLQDSNSSIVRSTSGRTVLAAHQKLRLYGLSEQQIEDVIAKGEPLEHITILAPFGGVVVHKNALEGMYVEEGTQLYTIADLSKLWVVMDAYESDLAWLRYGQNVEFGVEAYPGEVFHGRVAFIDPLLDDRTRTVKIRLNVDNREGRLKPDMFVSARAQSVLTAHGKVVDEDLANKWMCPMHPEVVADEAIACPECGMALVSASELGFVEATQAQLSQVIPSTAPLITGERAVVYVKLQNQESPAYEGRVISLGPRAGDWYVVTAGLKEGEEVVVHGNFKIDSELQIRARPSMMNPEQTVDGHEVPSMVAMDGMATMDGLDRGEESMHAPTAFKQQLGVVLDSYLRLQRDLAADRDNPKAAEGIVKGIESVQMGLLKGDSHAAWMGQRSVLLKRAQDLAGAWNLGRRRVLFSPFTEEFTRTLKTFGYLRDAGDVGIFRCPMAIDGDPADWLQEGEQTRNPYIGTAMIGCGSFTETLKQEN